MTQASQSYRYLDLFVGLFVATLIISNILAQKLAAFGPYSLTAGIILFPVAYILGDILTEVYGYRIARRVIWIGFAGSALFSLMAYIAVMLPPAPQWPFQEQFATTLQQVPRIVLASLLAYLAGEFANSFVLSRMKIAMKGERLWARTIGSTVVGQGVDTAIFAVVAFYGIVPFGVIIQIAIAGYIFKVVYEVLATPVTYAVVNRVKKAEGVDTFDHGVDYNPFSMSKQD